MTYIKWLSIASLLLATCSRGPAGVLVDIGAWPDGAVSLQVSGTLNGAPSASPLSYPNGTTRFVAYVPDGQSGQLDLFIAAVDANNCPRASAGVQVDVNTGLRAIVETHVDLTPVTRPYYCPAPEIQDLTPGLGPTSGGLAFTLRGQGILPNASVSIAGIPVTDVKVGSSVSLSGTIPAAPSAFGFVPVVLRNFDGQTTTRNDLFAYYSSQIQFASMTPIATDKNPTGVVSGDWNGDNRMDLAVSNGVSSVSVLFGNGIGGFASPTTIPIGSNVTSIAAGDFNSDKKPDLVVVSYGSNSAKLLLNNGMGVFAPGSDILEQLGIPGRVSVADVNGDNRMDLIVPCGFTRTVNVLLGTGLGSFTSSGTFPVGMNPNSADVGDFDGDQKLDIAVTNTADGNVSILLGNGQGQFTAAAVPTLNAANIPTAIATGDVNEDRKTDLVFIDTGDHTATVELGNGAGGFTGANRFAAGNTPMAVVLIDINGDRHLDMAIASSGDNTVRILLGDGTGRFGQAVSVVVGNSPRALTVADINGDKKPDLVTANYQGDNISVLLNQSQ